MTVEAAIWFIVAIYGIPVILFAIIGGILGGIEDAAAGASIGFGLGTIVLMGTFAVLGLVALTN